jgi:cytochrome c oxidase cbb3-type subunit 2
MNHDIVEKNIGLMLVLIVVAISFGGLVQIVPQMFLKETTEPVAGLKPLTALQLEGRDVYIREGCNNCHSQMIRALRSEVERYGHYSVAGESVWEHPFLWGSKRTGPDLARVGGRYSDEWHRVHLYSPRDVVPESIMPAYPWLLDNELDGADTAAKMRALRTVGVPYTDDDIKGAHDAVAGQTEMDAMIAYLQQLGTVLKPLAINDAGTAQSAPGEVQP